MTTEQLKQGNDIGTKIKSKEICLKSLQDLYIGEIILKMKDSEIVLVDGIVNKDLYYKTKQMFIENAENEIADLYNKLKEI